MGRIKHDQDEEQEAFILEASEDISSLEKDSQNLKSAWKSHLRSILEFMMASAIVILLIRSSVDMTAPKRSPVPECTFLRFLLAIQEH